MIKSPIDYSQDNAINLMASIRNAISNKKAAHNDLKSISSDYLKGFDNIVLFIIDGLAYHFVEKRFQNLFNEFNNQVIHPIFPSATAPALTSYATWLTPQEHWLPWWYTFFKEIGILTSVLPFTSRTWVALSDKIDCNYYYDTQSIYEFSERKNYIFNKNYLITSDYSQAFAKNATRFACSDFWDLCDKLWDTIKSSNDKKYCYAYDPDFDSLCHEYWIGSSETFNYASTIFSTINDFLEKIKWTNTVVMITADHWMINSIPERNIKAENYPEFVDMLTMPMAWETRAQFCHVKAWEDKHFEERVEKNFSEYCYCYKSKELLESWWFWEGEIHKWFLDRIWDYILVMKDNYIIVDSVLWQHRTPLIWNHWWISDEELNIPLLWKSV